VVNTDVFVQLSVIESSANEFLVAPTEANSIDAMSAIVL
jgi:hypothetical protein